MFLNAHDSEKKISRKVIFSESDRNVFILADPSGQHGNIVQPTVCLFV